MENMQRSISQITSCTHTFGIFHDNYRTISWYAQYQRACNETNQWLLRKMRFCLLSQHHCHFFLDESLHQSMQRITLVSSSSNGYVCLFEVVFVFNDNSYRVSFCCSNCTNWHQLSIAHTFPTLTWNQQRKRI